MTSERPAQRFAASSFPQIQEIRLFGTPATLVNLSSSGILLECGERSVPGGVLTIEFVGTFSPSSVQGRVIRCEVVGIAPSGSMRYRIGLAFKKPLVLPDQAGARTETPASAAAPPPPAAPAETPPPPARSGTRTAKVESPVVRNRW
jgi:hypothetical protein